MAIQGSRTNIIFTTHHCHLCVQVEKKMLVMERSGGRVKDFASNLSLYFYTLYLVIFLHLGLI